MNLIRMIGADDTVVSVTLEVSRISPRTDEVALGGSIVGYVTRAEHCFVASVGPQLRSSHRCGSFDLWDKAAAELLIPGRD